MVLNVQGHQPKLLWKPSADLNTCISLNIKKWTYIINDILQHHFLIYKGKIRWRLYIWCNRVYKGEIQFYGHTIFVNNGGRECGVIEYKGGKGQAK